MSYDNNNRGSIWKNEKKETETHPDFTGQAEVDGVQYWVSAWRRRADAKPSAPALSFSFKPKEARVGNMPQPARDQESNLNDDIPF